MHPHHPLDDRLPEMLRSGQRLRGVFNGLPSPALIEMCAYAGFDFVVIDNEHGSADLQTTEHMLRAARASGSPPVVRCFEADIARTLDMGASGLQIPMVNTAVQAAIEQVLRAVAAAGKCPGVLALNLDEEDRYAAWGGRCFASVTTGLITQAFRQAAQGLRPAVDY